MRGWGVGWGVAQALLAKVTRPRLASGCVRVVSPFSSPVLPGLYTTVRNTCISIKSIKCAKIYEQCASIPRAGI